VGQEIRNFFPCSFCCGGVTRVARSEHGREGRANWEELVLSLRALQTALLHSTLPAMRIIDRQSARADIGAG
jgi:hypothetical protein